MKTLSLFDPYSTIPISKAFLIGPGTVGIISAWGMSKSKIVTEPGEPTNTPALAIIQQLIFDDVPFPQGMECGAEAPLEVEAPTSHAEDVTQCGLWALSACQNKVVIAVPGVYRIRLNDVGQLGTIQISMARFTKQDAGWLPRGIILGEN